MKLDRKQKIQVRRNRIIHDSVASWYERIHTEIYNPTEQLRIERVLREALSQVTSCEDTPQVLDFGAGTGNLSGHLLRLGTQVIAADVSEFSLRILQEKYSSFKQLNTLVLNGVDLSCLEDGSQDMIVTYSVLHHVPDYLNSVREFVRVLKPGGVIYIDHEVAPHYWSDLGGDYKEYIARLSRQFGKSRVEILIRKVTNIFSPRAWRRFVMRKIFDLSEEGDIHVTKDDHIEWNSIENILLEECSLIRKQDYLVCRETRLDPTLHLEYKDKCSDMRMLIYQKKMPLHQNL
jgi:ubiquinone/menaquinone biosynthesis C-methylase UbiE